MNDEQPATPQPAEPVACPIGIAPEASMFCSAGYCDVCVARRAATPQQPAAASAGASELETMKRSMLAAADRAELVSHSLAQLKYLIADWVPLEFHERADRAIAALQSPPVAPARWEKLKAAGFTARPKITNALGYARDSDGDDEPAPTTHVGDSNFELWYEYSCIKTADPKQLARDAYAAGIGEGATIATLACNPPDRAVATAQQSEAPRFDPKLPAACQVLVGMLNKIQDKCRPGYMVSKFVVDWISESRAIAQAIEAAVQNASPAHPAAGEATERGAS